MRVVQLKRGRIIKFAGIGLFVLALLVLVAQRTGYKLRSTDDFANAAQRIQQHFNNIGVHDGKHSASGSKDQSYPDDLPKFLGTGKSGNFEPGTDVKVAKSSSPGENGKGHHVRVEQKVEEERLKGKLICQ